MFGGAHRSEEAQRQLRQCQQLLHKILMLATGILWLCMSFASVGDSLVVWKYILAGTAFISAAALLIAVITDKCRHLLWLFVGHAVLLIVAIIVRYVSMTADAQSMPRSEVYGGVIAIAFLLAVIYLVVKYIVYLSARNDERAMKPVEEESVAIAVE
ncbi:hypothetical protein AAVH_16201 [Aphelenchoides avenae]|nr:hypothetical protein AAVH_16201 [Aphelenchus avenae]